MAVAGDAVDRTAAAGDAEDDKERLMVCGRMRRSKRMTMTFIFDLRNFAVAQIRQTGRRRPTTQLAPSPSPPILQLSSEAKKILSTEINKPQPATSLCKPAMTANQSNTAASTTATTRTISHIHNNPPIAPDTNNKPISTANSSTDTPAKSKLTAEDIELLREAYPDAFEGGQNPFTHSACAPIPFDGNWNNYVKAHKQADRFISDFDQ